MVSTPLISVNFVSEQPNPTHPACNLGRTEPNKKKHTHTRARTSSPLFEFRRYALRTSETYLIAAAAVATALSSSSSSSPDEGDGVKGTRLFEALEGWDKPYVRAPQNDVDGVTGQRTTGGGGGGGGEGAIDTAAVEAIGVSIEEVE